MKQERYSDSAIFLSKTIREERLNKTQIIMLDTEDYSLVCDAVYSGGFFTFFEGHKPITSNTVVRQTVTYSNVKTSLSEMEGFTATVADIYNKVRFDQTEFFLPNLFIIHISSEVSSSAFEPLRDFIRISDQFDDEQNVLHTSCVILYGNPSSLPEDILNYTAILDVPLPSEEEIRKTICNMLKEDRLEELKKEDADNLTKKLIGLSRFEIRKFLANVIRRQDSDGRSLIYDEKERNTFLAEEKKKYIRNYGGVLELQVFKGDSFDVIGMEKLEDYCNSILTDPEKLAEKGLTPPKGVLLCGISGCGKSAAVELVSRKTGISTVLKMDTGALMNSLVGNSEKNMRNALKCAESMQPCILWIDEIEKAFDNAGSRSGDGGTFQRMFATLLTWMQRDDHQCFIFATSNNIEQLPDEFFRSGRFDELFSTFLPTAKQCIEIMKTHMQRADKRARNATYTEDNPNGVPVFDEDCYKNGNKERDDKDYFQILDEFFKDKSENEYVFLNGADVEKLVKITIMNYDNTDIFEGITHSHPIKFDDWSSAVKTIINQQANTFYGKGKMAHKNIAFQYAKLLQDKFVPVSDDNAFTISWLEDLIADSADSVETDGKRRQPKQPESYDDAMRICFENQIREKFKSPKSSTVQSRYEDIDKLLSEI